MQQAQTLANRVAIVTGASSGIGRATARLLAQHGAKLVLAARRRAPLEALVAELAGSCGGEALALAGDVAEEAFAEELVTAAVQRFGGLDIAVNNAGTLGPMTSVTALALDAWRAVLDTNLTGAFLGAKHQLPALMRRGGGALVFTSSFVGYTLGLAGTAAYASSKSGLVGLATTLAAEFGPQGIRVNVLMPGGTDTPMAREFADDEDALAAVASMHALGRIASPDEIARAALFLASDESSFMTGSVLRVDGGVSIYRA